MRRYELLPGVFLNHIPAHNTSDFLCSISILSQLNRDTAALNAAIPLVLTKGSLLCPSETEIEAKLQSLSAAHLEPLVRRVGEIHAIGLRLSVNSASPLSHAQMRNLVDFLCDVFSSPNTKAGLMQIANVDKAKNELLQIIDQRSDDTSSDPFLRCAEEMCSYEDYCVGPYGAEADVSSIHYKKISKYFRSLLQSAPIEIICICASDSELLNKYFRSALSTLPRSTVDYDLGTDVRLNAVEDQLRICDDTPAGNDTCTQILGCRIGESMEEPDEAAILVLNKLLKAVVDLPKGIIMIPDPSGVGTNSISPELLQILHDVAHMTISEDEVADVRTQLASEIRQCSDSVENLEAFYLSSILSGAEYSPAELAELVEDVQLSDLAAVAAGLAPDLLYCS